MGYFLRCATRTSTAIKQPVFATSNILMKFLRSVGLQTDI